MIQTLPIITIDVTQPVLDIDEAVKDYTRMLGYMWGIPEEYLIPKRFVMDKRTNHSMSFSIVHAVKPATPAWKIAFVLTVVFVLLIVGLS